MLLVHSSHVTVPHHVLFQGYSTSSGLVGSKAHVEPSLHSIDRSYMNASSMWVTVENVVGNYRNSNNIVPDDTLRDRRSKGVLLRRNNEMAIWIGLGDEKDSTKSI